jgi:hypothetical protein
VSVFVVIVCAAVCEYSVYPRLAPTRFTGTHAVSLQV